MAELCLNLNMKNETKLYSLNDLDRTESGMDKLKKICPFSENQLISLHCNDELNSNDLYIENFVNNLICIFENSSLYKLLIKFDKRKKYLITCKEKLNELKEKCTELQENVWKIEKKVLVKKGKCADKNLVKKTITYEESIYDDSSLNSLEQNLLIIQKTILDDHCLLLYKMEIIVFEIEQKIYSIVHLEDEQVKQKESENAISSLFIFIQYITCDKDIEKLIRKWFTYLIEDFFKDKTFYKQLFLLNHILRCPNDKIVWFTYFFDCPNPFNANSNEEAIKMLNFCLVAISTILSPVKDKEKLFKISNNEKNKENLKKNFDENDKNDVSIDDFWHLLDTECEYGEDIQLDKFSLTECDILNLLFKVPFDDLIKFLTQGIKYPSSEKEENGFIFGEYSELSILKLISVCTQIVKILRKGLLSFNCMRFKSLSDYITLMIKKTVEAVSGFWKKCKSYFYTQDQALIIRIQVEYDHFILRSVVTILSCQKYGVWKFLSVIPFDGITESMIWHIVWVFYNGRDEIDELGGLCPYFSDSYWKSKFNEKFVKISFKEKLENLSSNELQCLIRSLGNMITSRKKEESEFIRTISIDMFEICFYEPLENDNLVKFFEKIFPSFTPHQFFIINSILINIDKTEKINQNCIEFFSNIDLQKWIPDNFILEIFNKWIFNQPITSLFNQLSRVILSRLNYDINEDGKLLISKKMQQEIALIVHDAINEHLNDKKLGQFLFSFSVWDHDSFVNYAKSSSFQQFMEWGWRMLLLLKLNPKSIEEIKTLDLNEIKCSLLKKGFENKNLYSIYLTLMMTTVGQNLDYLEENLNLICILLLNKVYIPSFKIIEYFIPLHINNSEQILANMKFNNLFKQLFINDEPMFVNRIIGMFKNQLDNNKKNNLIELLTFWINQLCNQACLIIKQNLASWFINSKSSLQKIVYILDNIFLIIFKDPILLQKAIEVVSVKSSEMQNLKLVRSTSIYSWFNSTENEKNNCDWITPLHYLYNNNSTKIYFGYVLIKADYLKIEKLWEEILFRMSNNHNLNIENIIKSVCSIYSVTNLPIDMIPVNAWAKLSIDCENDHPLLPIILFNFFVSFFSNSTNEGSMGLHCISKNLLTKIKVKINKLKTLEFKKKSNCQNEFSLLRLYHAYLLWIEDNHLHDAFVDLNHLNSNYLADFLESVFTGNTGLITNFINYEILNSKIDEVCKYWNEVDNLNYKFELHDSEMGYDFEFNYSEFKYSKFESIPTYDNGCLSTSQIESIFKLNSLHNLKSLKLTLPILQCKVKCLMRGNRVFNQNLNLLTKSNVDFLSCLSKLHKNKIQVDFFLVYCESKLKNRCLGPSSISFSYLKDELSLTNLTTIKRNRTEYNKLIDQLVSTPSETIIACVVYLKTVLKIFQEDQQDNSLIELLNYFLSFLGNDEIITYAPASNVFNILIDTLILNKNFKNEVTLYMINSAIKYPKLAQYFATRLSPSDCSSDNFLNMYKIIQENLFSAQSIILFMILSKFNLNYWLKESNFDDTAKLLGLLKEIFSSLGPSPNDDKQLLLGLYRKHLQLILINKFPSNLLPVFQMMITGMFEFSFYPVLWKDILFFFGLYLPSNQIESKHLIEELIKYANTQPLFNASDIYDILKVLLEKFTILLESNSTINLIVYFKNYFHTFLPVMATLSFIWINTNEYSPSNFDNIWFNCMELWNLWLYPSTIKLDFDLDNLNYLWTIYVGVIDRFLLKFKNNSSKILSLVFDKIIKTFDSDKEDTVKIFNVIEVHILNLDWSFFFPNKTNLNLMMKSVLDRNSICLKFVSKLVDLIDWKLYFETFDLNEIPSLIEDFSYVLINTDFDINKLCLEELPFHLIPANVLGNLANTIKNKIYLKKYLIDQDELSIFLFKLIELICVVNLQQKKIMNPILLQLEDKMNEKNSLISELQYKKLVYSYTICQIIDFEIVKDNLVYSKYPSELKMFFADFLYRLRLFENETLETHRMEIFNTILPIISNMSVTNARIINYKTLLKNASISKQFTLNLFLACSQTIYTNLDDFLYVCENSIINLANTNGKIEEISNVFDCSNIITNNFMNICLESEFYLSMYLIYFKLKADQSLVDLLNEFGHYFLKIKAEPKLEAKAFSIWFNIFIELEENLSKDNLILLPYALKLAKNLIVLTEEANYSKITFFAKNIKKNISFRSIFLCLSISSLLLNKLKQIISEDNPDFITINNYLKNILARLQTFKKNKNFVDLYMLIEKLINLLESDVDTREQGIPILKSWLLAYFSDANYFELMLKEHN